MDYGQFVYNYTSSQGATLRHGVVSAFGDGSTNGLLNTVAVKIAGDSTATTGIRYIGAPPKIGAVVTLVRDGNDLLALTPVAGTGGGHASCILGLTANAPLANGATTLTWDTAVYDPYSMFNGTQRIVVPFAGVYSVSASIYWAGSSAGNDRVLTIGSTKGSSQSIASQAIRVATGTFVASNFGQSAAALDYMDAGDSFYVTVSQDTGGTLNLLQTGGLPRFSVSHLGPKS
jgi:hypothetical protein